MTSSVASPDPAGAAATSDTGAESSNDGSTTGSSAVQPPLSFSQLFRFATTAEKYGLVLSGVASAGLGAVFPLFTIVFGNVVTITGSESDQDIGDSVAEQAGFFGYLAAAALVLSLPILSQISYGYMSTLAEKLAGRMQEAYFVALLRQDMPWHDVHEAGGEVASRLTADVDAYKAGIGMKLAEAIQAVSTFIAGLTIAFTADEQAWKMALVILACLPVMVVAMAAIGGGMKKKSDVANTLGAKASALLNETLSSIKVVMAFGGQDAESQRYAAKLAEVSAARTAVGMFTGGMMGVLIMGMFATYGVGLYYGSVAIAEDREANPECTDDPTLDHCFSPGTVVTVFFGIVIGGSSLGRLGPSLTAIVSAKTAAQKLYSVLDTPVKLDAMADESSGTIPQEVSASFELRDVTFAYPARPNVHALNNVCISIPAGKTVALVGPSGSGKSTVAQLVQRLYDPDSGSITMDGQDLKNLDLKWLRSQQGVVSQQPVLFADTIGANIRAGIPQHEKGIDAQAAVQRAAMVANAHEFITSLPDAYETQVGSAGSQLSGGQKQRVCIARAVVSHRKLRILDEATSALDSKSEGVVQAALDNMLADGEQDTTLIVAHRLSTISNADVIYVLNDGSVQQQGTHSELMEDESGLYFQLWQAQQLAGTTDASSAEAAGAAEAPKAAAAAPVAVEAAAPVANPLHATTDAVPEQVQLHDENENTKEADEAFKKWKLTLPPVPFSRVWELGAATRKVSIIGYIAAILGGVLMPGFAVALSEIIDVFFIKDSSEMKSEALQWMLVFFGIAVGGFITNFVGIYSLTIAGESMVRTLGTKAYNQLLRQECAFFDRPENTPGRLAGRVSKDAEAVRAVIGVNLNAMFQQGATCAVAVAVAFYSSWRIALIVMALAPIMAVTNAAHFKLATGMSNRINYEAKEMAHIATEAILNIRTVQSLGIQAAVLQRFQQQQLAPMRAAAKVGFLNGALAGSTLAIMIGSYGLVFYIGGIWIADGTLEFVDLLRSFMVLTFAAQGMGQASTYTVSKSAADASTRSLFAIMDRQSKIDPLSSDKGTLRSPDPAVVHIQLKDVVFAYPSRPAAAVLNGVSMELSGEKHSALVGQSGSGKSTIMQLLMRFYEPDSGTILVNGVDIQKLPINWLRKLFAWVPQEPTLFTETVAYNIAYGGETKLPPNTQQAAADEATLKQVAWFAASANASDFVAALPEQYLSVVGQGGSQLSGGQRQRIALARCLYRDAKVLLLDEPTSALDSASEAVVQASIDRILAKSGEQHGSITIAHRLSTVAASDYIAVMRAGMLVESGSHQSLLAQGGEYKALATAQG